MWLVRDFLRLGSYLATYSDGWNGAKRNHARPVFPRAFPRRRRICRWFWRWFPLGWTAARPGWFGICPCPDLGSNRSPVGWGRYCAKVGSSLIGATARLECEWTGTRTSHRHCKKEYWLSKWNVLTISLLKKVNPSLSSYKLPNSLIFITICLSIVALLRAIFKEEID